MIAVLANLTALNPLALGLVLCCLTPVATAAEALDEAPAPPQSRFVRTALALQSANDDERTDFASVALSELAVTYQAEADLARHQSRELARGNKLASWSAAVYGFVDQLVMVQEDIDLGFPVELRHLYGQVVGVVAGGRTVILSHPRADQQSVYELRVLTDFCGRHDCPRLTAAAQGEEPEPIPVSAAGVSPHWDFRESGPLCSHRGISLHFTSTTQLTDRRGICQQLMVEAETLAAELAWQQRHGVDIDWAGLSIQSTPRRPQHIVTLNRAGDSILASVPVFYGTGGLLQQMVPWLKTRYDGDREHANIELDAAALGWE